MPRLIWVFPGRTLSLLVCHVATQNTLVLKNKRKIWGLNLLVIIGRKKCWCYSVCCSGSSRGIQIWATSWQKPTKWHVCPAKTQISLGICSVWSETSLCAQKVAKDPTFLHADSEDSDQTGWMPRLIWVFAGRTGHFVDFVLRWLICMYYHVYEWILQIFS